MKAESLALIKKELEQLEFDQLKEICLRLARYKKENKELLTYLLFEAPDEQGYINSIKRETEEEFDSLPLSVYYLKKSLRKILRSLNRQIKYSQIPATEIELRIYFCEEVRRKKLPLEKNQVLTNIFLQQVKKIRQVLGKLEEDLQYDYKARVEELEA